MSSFITSGVWFGVGIAAQAAVFLLMSGRTRKNDLLLAGLLFVFAGLIGAGAAILPESGYTLTSNLFFGLMVFGLLFVAVFKNKILAKIDEHLLLFWNLIFLSVYFTQIPQLPAISIIVILLSLPVVLNALLPWSPPFFVKGLFYFWFLVMIVFLALAQFAFGPALTPFADRSALTLVITGMALFYIFVHVVWIVRLIPLQTEHQTAAAKLAQLEKDWTVIGSKYESTRLQPLKVFGLILIVGGALVANDIFFLLPSSLLTNLLIIATPAFIARPDRARI